MSLRERIENDLKAALKAGRKLEVSTLRFLLAGINNLAIEKQKELNDEDVISVLQKQVKQRKESMAAFTDGGRDDLALKEKGELEILSKYLPQQLTEGEIREIVCQAIRELNAGPKDFGKVMGEVMRRVKGKAEGGQVAKIVKENLP